MEIYEEKSDVTSIDKSHNCKNVHQSHLLVESKIKNKLFNIIRVHMMFINTFV